jgi:hypothetical protein
LLQPAASLRTFFGWLYALKPQNLSSRFWGILQRVMPALMGMKNILVINDEAHHCYRRHGCYWRLEEILGKLRRPFYDVVR